MGYIKRDDLDNFMHLQVPRKVWNMYLNKEISPVAFKIYIEFFDRLKISAYNNWIDNNGSVYIKYSYEEMMDILKVKSKGTISDALSELKKIDLILQEKGFNTSSKFYLNNILQKGEIIQSSEKSNYQDTQSSEKSNTEVRKIGLQSSEKLDANNNNANNNNLDIITTTKTDNINKIDPSSSSLEILEKDKIKQIKSALQMHGISVATCKNIMDLVYSKHIDLERIKAVLTVAPLKNWEDGAIYKALKENWNIEIKSYNIKKPKTISEEKARKVINKTLEDKEKRDREIERKEKLREIFETFPEHKKKYMEEKAEIIAKEKYPDNIYKVMARTESIYEVIEEYLKEKEVS
ncbi:replication initiator protein A [Fusobacterium varium]